MIVYQIRLFGVKLNNAKIKSIKSIVKLFYVNQIKYNYKRKFSSKSEQNVTKNERKLREQKELKANIRI